MITHCTRIEGLTAKDLQWQPTNVPGIHVSVISANTVNTVTPAYIVDTDTAAHYCIEGHHPKSQIGDYIAAGYDSMSLYYTCRGGLEVYMKQFVDLGPYSRIVRHIDCGQTAIKWTQCAARRRCTVVIDVYIFDIETEY